LINIAANRLEARAEQAQEPATYHQQPFPDSWACSPSATQNIAVLGFGRSGTTWISDIISKATGRLILFEPLHPSVTEMSREFSYSPISVDNAQTICSYLGDVIGKRHRKMWLMRNHVPVRLEEISPHFLDLIWENCNVLGFKEIRANFMLRWLQEDLGYRIVYVVRHPCAVVSSILRRHNFWEFGWPGTYELFLQRTLYHPHYQDHRIKDCRSVVEGATSAFEQYAVMWAITHAIVLPELKKLGLPLFYYEHFYTNPFESVRKLLDFIGTDKDNIHPAYIFTPSMTTLKTLHGLYGSEDLIHDGASIFWKDTLNPAQVARILDIIRCFDVGLYEASGLPRVLGSGPESPEPYQGIT
jgi:hypothetical protein